MLFEKYLAFAESKGRAPGTIEKAKTYFRLYLNPYYGENDMRLVSIDNHEFFLGELRKHDLKGASINRVRSFLSTYGSKHYSLWVVLLNMGLRIGEAVVLDVSQIDSTAHLIHVNRTWCKATRGIRYKTKNGSRIIGINNAAQEYLYPLLRGRSEGLIWTNENSNILNPEDLVKKVIPKLCKESGVKYIGVHGLRHTFATLYMQNGGYLTDLQEILGHSTPELTRKYYIHFSKNELSRKANIVSVGSSGNVIHAEFGKSLLQAKEEKSAQAAGVAV